MKNLFIKKKNTILLLFFIICFILAFFFHKSTKKIKIQKKKESQQTNNKQNIILKGDPPSELIILPPSPTSRNNLTYCPNYTPKDKEFSQVPLKYMHGISIIITAYKMAQFIKETLDSIARQTWFKKHKNYEILIGVDGCNETLKYLQGIMKNYKNLRVFMMESNKGTFITTNTIMSLAKYDSILRFDADDIMMPDLIKILMEKSESEDVDRIMFKCQNFGKKSDKIGWASGQIFMKHWVFDYFGGFMPWRCEGDGEFSNRVDKFLTVIRIPIILMKRRIHDSNLTTAKKTGLHSVFRRWHENYRLNISLNIKNINDAVIIKIIDDFQEIFPNTIIK